MKVRAKGPAELIGQDSVSALYHPRGLQRSGRGGATRSLMLPRGYLGDVIGIFGDLSVAEMHQFIAVVMCPGKTWTYESLARERETLSAEVSHTPGSSRTEGGGVLALGQDTRPSYHHIVARSRGGMRRGNLVRLPRGFHTQWHQVFANLTPEEASTFLDRILVPKASWTYDELRHVQIAIMRETSAKRRRRSA